MATRKGVDKVLVISPEKCIDCRTCEIICSFTKNKEFNPRNAAVSVLNYEEAFISVPIMCMHCEDAACMKICPVGAIQRIDDAVVLDQKKCIGCKMCISACPLGNVTFNSQQRSMVKCDLCGGDPQCAKYCPSGAIQYKEATPTNLNKKKVIAEKFKDLFGEVEE